jgi:hypothetical protein
MNSRVKVAIWTGSIGLCVFLVRRVMARRASIDLGAVSVEWLAQRRGVLDGLSP